MDEDEQQKKDKKDNTNARKSKGFIFRIEKKIDQESESYDPLKRNPMYAKADNTELWELASLTTHFHPSIMLFATNICEDVSISYPGDPLEDFSAIKFLDRFAFKNPKKYENTDNLPFYAKKKMCNPKSYKALQPGSAEYMSFAPEALQEEKFLYDFFVATTEREKEKEEKKRPKRRQKNPNDSDISDSEDDIYDSEEETEEFGDVDFSNNLQKKKTNKEKIKKTKKDDSSEEDFDSEEESGSDESEPEMDEDGEGFKSYSEGSDLEGSNLEGAEIDGQGEQDFDFSDEDDGPPKKKRKQNQAKSSKQDLAKEVESFLSKEKNKSLDNNKSLDKNKTFSKKKTLSKKKAQEYDIDEFTKMAEKFGNILEKNKDSGDANQYIVKGKVSAGQIRWEREQEELQRGRSHWRGGKYKKKGSHNQNSGKKFGKQKFGKKK